jgi:hypothetical protein
MGSSLYERQWSRYAYEHNAAHLVLHAQAQPGCAAGVVISSAKPVKTVETFVEDRRLDRY